MSKEMGVILVGLLVILTRTALGLPGNVQTAVFVLCGVALIVLGFLLRGESIARAGQAAPRRKQELPFVEHAPLGHSRAGEAASAAHERQGLTSLN